MSVSLLALKWKLPLTARACEVQEWVYCRYSTHLHETLNALAADMEVEVRVQMAAGYHECAVLLGPDRCVQYMRRCAATPSSSVLHSFHYVGCCAERWVVP